MCVLLQHGRDSILNKRRMKLKRLQRGRDGVLTRNLMRCNTTMSRQYKESVTPSMVLNEVEVIATKEFALFSQHHTITNLKKNLKQKIESIPRLDAIVMAIILESVGQVIGSDKTISIINISPSKTSRFTNVTYKLLYAYQVILQRPWNIFGQVKRFVLHHVICHRRCLTSVTIRL